MASIEREPFGDLSRAWLNAFMRVSKAKGREVPCLIVEIEAPQGVIREDHDIRHALDKSLADMNRRTPVNTVANTIFPWSMWNRSRSREELFRRYRTIYPVIKKSDSRNRFGTYFGRFLDLHGQLEHVLNTRDTGNHRRSAYQLVTFDAENDHVNSRQRGFPCLHQVSLVPDTQSNTLSVVGYYPSQTMYEKAYGNYLGLWRLGEFVAHEWNLTMVSLTCITAVARQTANTPQVNQLAATLAEDLEKFV